jgi:hypothetical protein
MRHNRKSLSGPQLSDEPDQRKNERSDDRNPTQEAKGVGIVLLVIHNRHLETTSGRVYETINAKLTGRIVKPA